MLEGLSAYFGFQKPTLEDMYKKYGIATGTDITALSPELQKQITSGMNANQGLFGLDSGQWGTIGQFGNVLGGAYDLYSNIWGDKSDLFDQQMKLMKQQYDTNEWLKNNYSTYSKNLGSGLAAAFGGGSTPAPAPAPAS